VKGIRAVVWKRAPSPEEYGISSVHLNLLLIQPIQVQLVELSLAILRNNRNSGKGKVLFKFMVAWKDVLKK